MNIRSLKTGETLKTLDEKRIDPIWIDLSYPTLELDPDENKEIDELAAFTKIELDDLKDCLDLNERSRFDDDDEGYFFIILRLPAEHPVVEERRITVPLGIFWDFSQRWIATVHTDYISLPLGHRKSKRKARFKMDIFNFLINILDSVIWTFELALDDLDDDLDLLEKGVSKATKPKMISRMFRLSKRTAYLHAALQSNVRAISEAKRHKQFLVTEDERDKWEDIENDAYQQVEMISLYKELLSSSLNAHSNTMSNELSDVMKLMTSISLVLMLPTLIGTFYGMNVNLPKAEPFSFWILVIISFILSGIAIILLRWIKWL
ncbi:MAG: magnesium transporter CorA family protein [Candidatus Odinarchaeota archaeon]